jgi:hypothetical protein
MPTFRNLFACLVHESWECVLDLVRNLRCLDPSSAVLLFDGSAVGDLLRAFPFGRYGVVCHPSPRPLAWGRLHEFALDCMRFGLEELGFDALTVVDSDQLLARPGYSTALAGFLAERPRVGLIGCCPQRQTDGSRSEPVASALREWDLWRPFLSRFPGDEKRAVYWSFWPSTVFSARAAQDLVRLYDTDGQLREILQRTAIFATEEVVLPTLVALLGHEVAAGPWSYDFVRYRTRYTQRQLGAALARPDVFWVHPVERRYDAPRRQEVRSHHGHYQAPSPAPDVGDGEPGLALTLPLLGQMRRVPGWLEDDEADLLIASAVRALLGLPPPHNVVEIGSYCGRSTVVLGGVARAIGRGARVYAIDPHEGEVGALDCGIVRTQPTLAAFRRTISEARLAGVVEEVQARSCEVAWSAPVGLLLLDGLHDYANVARDFYHFEPFLVEGALVAFHDYADYYPGVQAFVNELSGCGGYHVVGRARSMIVLGKEKR